MGVVVVVDIPALTLDLCIVRSAARNSQMRRCYGRATTFDPLSIKNLRDGAPGIRFATADIGKLNARLNKTNWLEGECPESR
jgi:hypothetical protein